MGNGSHSLQASKVHSDQMPRQRDPRRAEMFRGTLQLRHPTNKDKKNLSSHQTVPSRCAVLSLCTNHFPFLAASSLTVALIWPTSLSSSWPKTIANISTAARTHNETVERLENRHGAQTRNETQCQPEVLRPPMWSHSGPGKAPHCVPQNGTNNVQTQMNEL